MKILQKDKNIQDNSYFNDTFSEYHPTVIFTYFALVLLFSMFVMNPVFLAISFFAALSYALYLGRTKTLKMLLKVILPMFLLIAIINPLFSHGGVTILAYLPDGNPFTLESVIYGTAAAFLMSSVILWFSCVNKIMTSDKIIFLFGRIVPTLSLLISMILRFIPKFKAQLKQVRASQHCIGRDITDGSIFRRIKNAIRIISVMILWSMENSVETADSMKNRGYGLPNRTSFALYRFEKRDAVFILFLICCGIYVFVGAVGGYVDYDYFPSLSSISVGIYDFSLYAVYLVMCLTPVAVDIKEDRKWKYIKSKI